jgi:hypothetical protein
MDRKGESVMCNSPVTGADAVYLTPATMAYALDKAIVSSLVPSLAQVYSNAMATTDMPTFYAAWNEVMTKVDQDPCDSTRPRSEWRQLFEGYDTFKRGILARFRQRQDELLGKKG